MHRVSIGSLFYLITIRRALFVEALIAMLDKRVTFGERGFTQGVYKEDLGFRRILY